MIKTTTDNMLKYLQNIKVDVAFDFRWAKRRHAKQGTGTLIDVHTKKIVMIANPSYKEAGNSQAMELFAATMIFKYLHSLKIPIEGVVHDKCMSAFNRIKHFYPNVIEYLDVGHRGQALKKRIQGLTSQCSELKGMCNKVKKHFYEAIKNSKTDVEEFCAIFLNGINHWMDMHDSPYCKHTIDLTVKKSKKPLSENAAEKLKPIMQEFANEAIQYIKGYNTCENESFNNLITYYAPKGIYWGNKYDMLVGLAVLHHNEGEKFRVNLLSTIMSAAGSPQLWKSEPADFPTIQLDDSDLPDSVLKRRRLDVKSNHKKSDGQNKPSNALRKAPHCRRCKVPMKGHKCPHRNNPTN